MLALDLRRGLGAGGELDVSFPRPRHIIKCLLHTSYRELRLRELSEVPQDSKMRVAKWELMA